MVSMKDIAKKCGVSVATVSKALNAQKDIGEETRKRICAAAEEMGYMANSVARTLKTNRSYNLGMLFGDETHSILGCEYYTHVMDGFKAEAESRGYDLTFINSRLGEDPATFARHCRHRGVDGVVVVWVDFEDPRIRALAAAGIPMVTVDHVLEGHTAVLSDNVRGVETLVRYAYDRGHRKIAYIHGQESAITRDRLLGFRQACRELELEIPDDYLIPCAYMDSDLCEEAVRKLMMLEEPPTCILFPDDYSFISGHYALMVCGFAIPSLAVDDRAISVMGYNGFNLARMIRLTTYTQNGQTIGRTAAAHLIERIEHPADFRPEQILVSGALMEGETVQDINE